MKKQNALNVLRELQDILKRVTIPAEIDMKIEMHLIYELYKEEDRVLERMLVMVAPTKEKAVEWIDDMKRVLCNRQNNYEIKSFKIDNDEAEIDWNDKKTV